MNGSIPLTPRDLWSIAVRRKWLILGAILLSLGVAATLCKVLPRSYRSNTLILVEGQKIPENYVQAVVGGSIEERLTLIEQHVMSRTLLGGVIEEFKLFQNDIRASGLEAVIANMRSNIEVKTVGNRGARRNTIGAFTISFAHEDPMTAMKVTAKLTSQFIEENLKAREQLVEGASEFLQQELGLARVRLEEQEQGIGQFKTQYMGELPQQMDANLRALDRYQTELNMVIEAQYSLTARLTQMEKAISDYGLNRVTVPQAGPAQGTRGGTTSLGLRLRELEQELVTLSAEYKETYPDIAHVKREIEQVKAQLAKSYGVQEIAGDDRELKTFDPFLHGLITQRGDLRVEREAIKRRKGRLKALIEDHEQRIARAPAREQELMILLRDYGNMQKNYQSLLEKRLNARVAENLERRQKGEQFRIIDPANVPAQPYKPDQERIMLLGLAFGCALGFGMAYLLEMLNPTFRRPEDLEMLLGIHVLAAIPDFAILYGKSAEQRLLGTAAAAVPADTRAVSVQAKRKPILEMLKRRHWRVGSGNGNQVPLDESLVAKWRPNSIVAEQYRVAATRLSLLEEGRSTTIVDVTSAVKGEGKTTTVVNLGYTLARDLGKRTLLVDCDFKSPVLHKYTDTPPEPGLTDLLNGGASFERCISSFGDIPCWVFPAGSRRSRVNDLSKTQQLAMILTTLRAQFEYILINMPPIFPLADMNVLAGLADVLVLVVKAGSTPQQVVQQAMNTLRVTTQAQVILNAVEAQTMPYYMKYDYQVHPAEGQRV